MKSHQELMLHSPKKNEYERKNCTNQIPQLSVSQIQPKWQFLSINILYILSFHHCVAINNC